MIASNKSICYYLYLGTQSLNEEWLILCKLSTNVVNNRIYSLLSPNKEKRFKPLTQKNFYLQPIDLKLYFWMVIGYWKNWDNNIHLPFSTLNFNNPPIIIWVFMTNKITFYINIWIACWCRDIKFVSNRHTLIFHLERRYHVGIIMVFPKLTATSTLQQHRLQWKILSPNGFFSH